MDSNLSDQQSRTEQAKHSNTDTLSQSVFADPQSFLNTIRSGFSAIDNAQSGTPGLITREEFQEYAKTGKDGKLRAAAQIAFDHFDELREMPKIPIPFMEQTSQATFINEHQRNGQLVPAISRDDLWHDIELLNGRTKQYTRSMKIVTGIETAAMGVMTGALGCTTAVAAVCAPPYAVLLGGFTAATGYLTYSGARDLYRVPSEIRDLARKNTQTLGSWPEINGGSAHKR